MKHFIQLLDQNQIKYTFAKMGNMLYLPEYHPAALHFSIDLSDQAKIETIEKYLKSHKKTLHFDYTLHTGCSDPDIHFHVMKSEEEKKLFDIEKKDAAIRAKYWEIYSKDKERAERFYRFMKRKLKTA